MGFRSLDDLIALGVGKMQILRLSTLTVLFAVSEGVGLSMLIPIAAYASGLGDEQGGTGELSGVGDRLSWLLGITDPNLTLALLLVIAALPFAVRIWLFARRETELADLKQRISLGVRRKALSAIIQADLGFLARRSPGELQAIATVEADRAAEALASRVAFLTATALAAVYFILLALLSPLLFLYTLPVFALVALALRRNGNRTDRLSRRLAQQNTQLGRRISDGIFGIERIKLRAQEAVAVGNLARITDRIARNVRQIDRLRVRIQIHTEPLLVLAVFVIVYLAIARVGMSFGIVGIFLLVVIRLVPQTLVLSHQWSNMRALMASQERLRGFLAEAERHRERDQGSREFVGIRQSIRLDAVHFDYPGDGNRETVLQDLTCVIPAYQTTAVVGRSGAGKTTLTRLLTGCYRPSRGSISIDGIPQHAFTLKSLRRRIAVVPQKPFFFDTSLRANLSYGIDGPPGDERIWEVLRLCHCKAFVEALPKGVDTAVGPHGARLSEGQRQRLAIAHGLLLTPSLLILDEPTAALDAESELAIQDTLRALAGHLTVLVIAHRFTTIRHANTILLLDRGRLLDQGDHPTLLQRSGLYRRLFMQQMPDEHPTQPKAAAG